MGINVIDKCKKCGKCCYKTLVLGSKIFPTKEKCQYLGDDNLCKTYENRPGWCWTSEQMMSVGELPPGCGYGE